MSERSSSSSQGDGSPPREEPDHPSAEKDNIEEDGVSEALDTGAGEIEDFDGQLLKDFKSGFRPLFVRNSTTTIYVVPQRIYMLKPKLYEDRYQYFGIVMNFDKFYPRSRLNNLHMLAHMQSILSRNRNNTFEGYLAAMNAMRLRIKQCYLVKIRINFKTLIALVLSCCHILDVLLLFFEGRLLPHVDQGCSTAIHELCMDMLLVQSQVPFFALQKIYDMLDLDQSVYPSLTNLCLHFFKEFLEFNEEVDPMPSNEIHHLLHLVHYHLLPSNNSHTQGLKRLFFSKMKCWRRRRQRKLPTSLSPSKRPHMISPIPAARRLQDAGVKFRKKKTNGFSNITFHRGVLEIPQLHVDNYTEILLRNLIAWEQCHPNVGVYFTSYGIFMDFIINTAEDVEILNRYGILEQTLGSEEEVASIFNGLSTNIFYIEDKDDFLPGVCNELNRYCQDKFNLWKANLMNDYFGNPWAIISVIAAIFLLILTSVQTFFSAYAYFRPP
ncbi:hypothetical protein H6P81_016967 [Aristolochia fimbriata]|uniref:Uncharacterized protein n=1 Tax=Aristolochia fimbriata TaxID=158543 RepID=A0AAV7DX26_ARIFI|nr:hypothetical protein H6P81_016967 [Aristolochia fimbriata]